MFTGLVEGIGKIVSIKRRGYNAHFEIDANFDLEDTNVGDSVAIEGCCLTVVSRLGNHFWADISDETLRVTSLGGLKEGDAVNVERAMKLGARLGGHLVQGHADGVGKIKSFQDVENGKELEVQVPKSLQKYIVNKGSIAINGVSLTVNKAEGDIISVRMIPHTVEGTTFKFKKAGDPVNLEVDIIGKYVEKLHFLGSDQFHEESEITEEFLRKHGF